jgi:predicted ester cyclase
MSERNKSVSRVAFEVWSSGELDRLDEFVAIDVVHHDPYDPHGADGLAGMKKAIMRNRTVFSDLRMTVDDQLAEGSKVATRWTATMTHEGKAVTLKGITIDRFENGTIVEAWRCMDMLDFLRQTGRADPPKRGTRS